MNIHKGFAIPPIWIHASQQKMRTFLASGRQANNVSIADLAFEHCRFIFCEQRINDKTKLEHSRVARG